MSNQEQVGGDRCGNPNCEEQQKPIRLSYRCVHCRIFLHPSVLGCSLSVGEGLQIRCLPGYGCNVPNTEWATSAPPTTEAQTFATPTTPPNTEGLTIATETIQTETAPPTPNMDLELVTWDNIDLDENSKPIGVFSKLFGTFYSKELRTICSKLGIKGVKNVRKSIMIQSILDKHHNRVAYLALRGCEEEVAEEAPKKQAQCSFRLMNILFSDRFAAEFANLGNIAGRRELDTGKAGDDQLFWTSVQKAFVENTEEFNDLLFTSNEILEVQVNEIDPSKIVNHDWKKLRKIWKAVNADYKASLNNFTQSGTHDDDFYSFCNGKLDVFYLRCHLELRPELNGTVEAALPDECFLSSDMPVSTKTSSEGSNKKRKSNSELVEALRGIGDSKMESEIALKKLFYMEKYDARQEKELTLKEKDFARREKEDDEKMVLQKRQSLWSEWQSIVTNISSLRRMLGELGNNDEGATDLKKDIESLVELKNEIAKQLGMNR